MARDAHEALQVLVSRLSDNFPGYGSCISQISNLVAIHPPPFVYINDPETPRTTSSVLNTVLSSLCDPLSGVSSGHNRIYYALVNAVACFTPLHVSACGSHLVALTLRSRLIVLYNFERFLRGEAEIWETWIDIQLGPKFYTSRYLAFENNAIPVATGFGLFILGNNFYVWRQVYRSFKEHQSWGYTCLSGKVLWKPSLAVIYQLSSNDG